MKKVLMMMALVFMALSTNAQSAVSKQLQKQRNFVQNLM